MAADIGERWKQEFLEVVRRSNHSLALRQAGLQQNFGDWTTALTQVAVATCEAMGWQATARGHVLQLLPVAQSEYLAMDVMAFAEEKPRWIFPAAVVELENNPNNARIAYSLWKVLCVRADLRVVVCYRRTHELSAELARYLEKEVVASIGREVLIGLPGETLLVVGSRGDAETFPYGFFKWWKLEHNTARFETL